MALVSRMYINPGRRILTSATACATDSLALKIRRLSPHVLQIISAAEVDEQRGYLQVSTGRHIGTECVEVFAYVDVRRLRKRKLGSGVREDGTVNRDIRGVVAGVFTVGWIQWISIMR